MSDKLRNTAIAVFLFVASLVFHSQYLGIASYELDEAVHLWFAQMPYETVVEKAADDPNPPVYNLLISAWIKQFGVEEVSSRMFSAIAGSLAAVVLFLLGLRNFGLFPGVLIALLFCLSPVQYRFTHMARPYALLMFAVALSYTFLLEWIRRPKKTKNAILYYITTALMIYVHPTSVFNIPAQGLILLIANRKSLKALTVSVLPLLLAVATYLVWFLVIPYFERSHQMWFEPPGYDEIFYVLKVFYGNVYVLIAHLLLLVGLVLRWKQIQLSDTRFWVIAIWAIVPILSSIAFSYLVKPIFQDKYILSAQPGMMVFCALTIHYLFKEYRVLKLAVSVGVIYGISTSLIIPPKPFGGDWKGAVEYVNTGKQKESAAVMVEPEYEYRTYAFYHNLDFYKNYDSTINLLGSDDVFTAWDNIYDNKFDWPNYQYVYVIHSFAHQTLADLTVPFELLDEVGICHEEKRLDAIKIRKYKFKDPIQSNEGFIVDAFDDDVSGIQSFTSDIPYSTSVELSLAAVEQDTISIRCSVDIRSESVLTGAEFFVTLESKVNGFLLYESQKIDVSADSVNAWFRVERTIQDLPITKDSKIKTFVGNSAGEAFEIDNLQIQFLD